MLDFIVNSLIAAIQSLLGYIRGFIIEVVDWVYSTITTILDGALDLFLYIFGGIWDFFGGMIDSALASINDKLEVINQIPFFNPEFLTTINQVIPLTEIFTVSVILIEIWVIVFCVKVALKLIPTIY